MVNDCLVVRARFTFMILLSQSVLGARSISLVFFDRVQGSRMLCKIHLDN